MPANFVSEWIELTNWDGVGTVLVLIKCYQCPFNSVAVNRTCLKFEASLDTGYQRP